MIQTSIQNFFNTIFYNLNYILPLISKGEFIWSTTIFIFSFLFLTYIFITLYLTVFLFFRKNKNLTQIKHISIIKDMEFIKFKSNLFNFYYSILIILFIFLFRNNSFHLLLSLNFYFLFFISVIFFTLISNYFILFLFKIYLNIKLFMSMLDRINFNLTPLNFSLTSLKFNVNHQTRSFSIY